GLREDRREALVDRVREDEGAADHRHAEHDREGGERRAELPPREALQGDPDHRAVSSFMTASTSAAVVCWSSRTISPSARKRMRSAIAAAPGSCVTMTVVWPKVSTESRIRCRISSLVAESRLPVGSSAKTTGGREEYLARGRSVEPGQDVHQRRRSGARGAHHGGELAAHHLERDPTESLDGGVALAVAAGHVARGDDGVLARCWRARARFGHGL